MQKNLIFKNQVFFVQRVACMKSPQAYIPKNQIFKNGDYEQIIKIMNIL